MMALADQLTNSGKYTAIVLSVETGAAFKHDPAMAQKYILSNWIGTAKFALPEELQPPKLPYIKEETGLTEINVKNYLEAWTLSSPRPLVVFVDEID
ncbi:MAG: ATP-binding protein, partial [Okeania sp. SIO2D1]|nr:ATP-binding protein [Okeania sp. SIO2D1]